jgi:hypothetical protein
MPEPLRAIRRVAAEPTQWSLTKNAESRSVPSLFSSTPSCLLLSLSDNHTYSSRETLPKMASP